MITTTSWNKLKKGLLKNPKVQKEYNKLEPEYALISQLIDIRIKKRLTQKALAKKLGTKQSAIARLESGRANPTLDFLGRTAKVLGKRLTISFE